MKIELQAHDGRVMSCRLPYPGCGHVVATARQCECSPEMELRIVGGAITQGYDTLSAPAYCVMCRGNMGTLVVTADTLFGIEEDNRVLNGQPRVY